MDIVEKFWKEYINTDTIERRKLIEEKMLPLFELKETLTIKEREHIIITILKGYFDDLIGIAYHIGHTNALDENNILHGKDADRFMKEMEKNNIRMLQDADRRVKGEEK